MDLRWHEYVLASVPFTDGCTQAVQSCVAQYAADPSLVNCQDAAGNIYMQQQASDGSNSDYATAFADILNICLLDGFMSGTWDNGVDGQWYWMDAGPNCYNGRPTTLPTCLLFLKI